LLHASTLVSAPIAKPMAKTRTRIMCTLGPERSIDE
jgi:hypothetical protein